MTDAFAVLDQPRRPWLEPEQLKQAFHAKALRAHPDAQPPDGDADAFSALNEAHQILQDPKRRLQHLLSLSGSAPDQHPTTTPKEIEELFPLVAALSQRATALVQQSAGATTALSRSLLKRQLLHVLEELNTTGAKLAALQQNAMTRLQELDRTWEDHVAELQDIYLQFSYLTRWTAELDEKHTQLSMC